MNFAKGNKYMFKVRGRRQNGASTYFLIEANGLECTVKAYEFQKKNPPSEIYCICKGVTESGKPVFMQDIATLLARLYKVGDICDFRVKSQPGSRDYYEVMDENDFCFRMVNYGDEKYYSNQMVRCRITFMNMVRVEAEPATGIRGVSIPFFDLQKLQSLLPAESADPRMLQCLLKSSAFETIQHQYYDGNPLWVKNAIHTACNQLNDLIKSRSSHKEILLHTLEGLCVNILENSDYLTTASETESAEYQNFLNSVIDRTRDHLAAIEMIHAGTGCEYVYDVLRHLRTSGYVVNPQSRMRRVLSILFLTRSNLLEYMKELFTVLRDQHENVRFMSLFSRSIIEILNLFIERMRHKTENGLLATDAPDLEIMVHALAAMLLLIRTDAENDNDYKIYQSMLFRHASMLVKDTESVTNLNFKAYEALFGSYSLNLGYSWHNLSNIPALCSNLALSTPPLAAKSVETQVYRGNNVELQVSGHDICLQPTKRDHETLNVLPDNIFNSVNVQALLPHNLPEAPQELSALQKTQQMWNEIERSLFNSDETDCRILHPKRMPQPGDEVTIRITGPSSTPHEFLCRIEDDEYWGTGTINPSKHIVSYNVHVTHQSFLDPVTGKPYLLRATVQRIDPNGNIQFSMRKNIARFNQETLDTSVRNLVVVSRVDQLQYLCITRGGVTMFIPRTETTPLLRLNDFIIADIVSLVGEGNVEGSIAGRTYETFERDEAFNALIADFSEGRLYEGPIDTEIMDMHKTVSQPMPRAYLRELISVTDRKGMIQQNLIDIYNYLALAGIFSRIIGDRTLIDYYRRQKEIIIAIREFDDSGNFDEKRIKQVMTEDKSLLEQYPELRESIIRLRIINSLDNNDRNPYLWEQANNSPDKKTRRMASMVLAHNLVTDEEAGALRSTLRCDLYTMLKLK